MFTSLCQTTCLFIEYTEQNIVNDFFNYYFKEPNFNTKTFP